MGTRRLVRGRGAAGVAMGAVCCFQAESTGGVLSIVLRRGAEFAGALADLTD